LQSQRPFPLPFEHSFASCKALGFGSIQTTVSLDNGGPFLKRFIPILFAISEALQRDFGKVIKLIPQPFNILIANRSAGGGQEPATLLERQPIKAAVIGHTSTVHLVKAMCCAALERLH
jgi:hypothetical protein